MFEHAKAIGVFPKVISAAMGWAAVTVRRDRGQAGDGKWGPPAEFALTGQRGLQIGAEATELVLFFMSDGSVKSLLDSKVTLGGKAGIAAGPGRRQAEAATDLKLNAEIYSYAKSKGLFAGISFEGAKLAADKDDNQHVFGTSKTEDILSRQGDEMPAAAQDVPRGALPRSSKQPPHRGPCAVRGALRDAQLEDQSCDGMQRTLEPLEAGAARVVDLRDHALEPAHPVEVVDHPVGGRKSFTTTTIRTRELS
jgi:lipid-binding SYLF domain-containing protein